MVDLIRELPAGPIDMATVAQLFRVSDQTVRDWRKRKDNPLKATRLGKFYYTTRENIQAFSQQPEMPTEQPQQVSLLEQMVDRVLRRHGIID